MTIENEIPTAKIFAILESNQTLLSVKNIKFTPCLTLSKDDFFREIVHVDKL
jgi:hypothetical protein